MPSKKHPPAEGIVPILSGADKDKIRAELRYVAAVLAEGKDDKAKSFFEKLGALFSNGFVLLIAGALITSFLVPSLEHSYNEKKQRRTLREECRSEFLRYCNSIWEEFYLIHPLVSEISITKKEYNKYFQKLTDIKLKRYDAFAKLESVAIVFRDAGDKQSDIEQKLTEYATSINHVSQRIDTWLRRLYCYTEGCDNESIPPDYSSYDEFVELHDELDNTEVLSKQLSEMIVRRLKQE